MPPDQRQNCSQPLWLKEKNQKYKGKAHTFQGGNSFSHLTQKKGSIFYIFQCNYLAGSSGVPLQIFNKCLQLTGKTKKVDIKCKQDFHITIKYMQMNGVN